MSRHQAVAAKLYGRKYIAIELASEYAQIATNRLQNVETHLHKEYAQISGNRLQEMEAYL